MISMVSLGRRSIIDRSGRRDKLEMFTKRLNPIVDYVAQFSQK